MALLRNKTHKPRPPQKTVTPISTAPVIDQNMLGDIILAALHGLKSGSIEITVHEGRVTYIERREKELMNLPCPSEDNFDYSPALSATLN
jgi:hypothetical protein